MLCSFIHLFIHQDTASAWMKRTEVQKVQKKIMLLSPKPASTVLIPLTANQCASLVATRTHLQNSASCSETGVPTHFAGYILVESQKRKCLQADSNITNSCYKKSIMTTIITMTWKKNLQNVQFTNQLPKKLPFFQNVIRHYKASLLRGDVLRYRASNTRSPGWPQCSRRESGLNQRKRSPQGWAPYSVCKKSIQNHYQDEAGMPSRDTV